MKIRRIKRINKKGILISEGIRIILAVIAVLLLVYLAVQLTGLFTKKSAQEQAKESMKRLIDEIKFVEKGEKIESELFIESPNDWWIIAWPYKEDVRKPKQCGNYCVCICPIPASDIKLSSIDNSLERCDSIGICENVDKPIKTIYESKVEKGYAKIIKYFIGLFNDVNNVPLDIGSPLPIKIKLINGEIQIIK